MPTPTLHNPTLANPLPGSTQRDASLPLRDAATKPRLSASDRAATPPLAPTPPAVPALSGRRPAVEPTAPAPVYAEIWKDGIKVANIDTHGTITSFAGPPLAPPVGGAGGPWLAATRAAQVARAVGGEIRINGLVVDAGTAKMRVRLELAYGR